MTCGLCFYGQLPDGLEQRMSKHVTARASKANTKPFFKMEIFSTERYYPLIICMLLFGLFKMDKLWQRNIRVLMHDVW